MDVYYRKGPNIAVAIMLAVPVLGLIVISLSSAGVPLRPTAARSVLLCALVSVPAAALLAARVEPAPFAAVLLTILAMVLGGVSDPVLLMGAAAGLAWWRQDAFDRPLDPPALMDDIAAGLRRLLKDSPGAVSRALCGVALVGAAGVGIGVAMTGQEIVSPKVLVGCLMAGVGLVASSAALPDDA